MYAFADVNVSSKIIYNKVMKINFLKKNSKCIMRDSGPGILTNAYCLNPLFSGQIFQKGLGHFFIHIFILVKQR